MEDIDLAIEEVEEIVEAEDALDIEYLAAQFVEILEVSDAADKEAAIESLVDALGPESISFFKEALDVII